MGRRGGGRRGAGEQEEVSINKSENYVLFCQIAI